MNVATIGGRPAMLSPIPNLSRDLEREIDWFLSHGLDQSRPPSREVLSEAARQVVALRHLCEPVSQDLVGSWIDRVAIACSNPPGDGMRKMRAASVYETSGDTCMGAWTRENRARFSREQTFFPGDGEVDRFIRPLSDRLRAQLRGAEALVNSQKRVAAPSEPEMTEAQRLAMALSMQGLAQSMRAGLEERPADPVSGPAQARPLPDELLLAQYEAQAAAGGPLASAASARAGALRRRLTRR